MRGRVVGRGVGERGPGWGGGQAEDVILPLTHRDAERTARAQIEQMLRERCSQI